MDSLGINLGVATFNVNGINATHARDERIKVFEWLKLKHESVIFLQETHSTPEAEKQWEQECSGEEEYFLANVGRCILVDLKVEEIPFRFVNFYGPNKDDTSFLEETFKRAYGNKTHYNILIGGDFNTVMDNTLDLSNSVSGGRRTPPNPT